MLKIGITGGIGSGKTTVCRLFEMLGVPVYYADEASKKILDDDQQVHQSIVDLFGKEILDGAGKIDKKKLGGIVFKDKGKLDKLNAIVHPAVGLHFENWVKKQTSPYILKEAAILFESGANKQVDKVLLVTAPMELKIARTMKRDGVAREEVERRIQLQLTDEEKAKRSDFLIKNNDQEMLIPQVLAIHTALIGK